MLSFRLRQVHCICVCLNSLPCRRFGIDVIFLMLKLNPPMSHLKFRAGTLNTLLTFISLLFAVYFVCKLMSLAT
jgi:hypothetical protein